MSFSSRQLVRQPMSTASLTLARQTVYATARNLRANEGRTGDTVHGDAWRCESGEVVRAMPWRKFYKFNFFYGVTSCNDEIVKCTCVTVGVTHFVNSS